MDGDRRLSSSRVFLRPWLPVLFTFDDDFARHSIFFEHGTNIARSSALAHRQLGSDWLAFTTFRSIR